MIVIAYAHITCIIECRRQGVCLVRIDYFDGEYKYREFRVKIL